MTCAAFSIKFAKTNQKSAENSEFCEKNSLLLVSYSLLSLGVPRRALRGPHAHAGGHGRQVRLAAERAGPGRGERPSAAAS